MKNKILNLEELFSFLWKRKLWWLIPMIIVFLTFGIVVVLLGSSPFGPLIYPLF